MIPRIEFAITTLASVLLTSCHVDTSDKVRCDVPSDCLEGYECREHRCVRDEPNSSDEPPLAPTELDGIRGGARYLLSWRDNATDESGYLIEGKASATEEFSTWAVTPANRSEHQLVFTKKGSYTFRVFAVRGTDAEQERSSPSNQVTAVVDVPSKPDLESSLEGTRLKLSWAPVDFHGETEECGYRIHDGYCGMTSGIGPVVQTVDCDATGVSVDTEWAFIDDFPQEQYVVVAFNRWGDSMPASVCLGALL